MLLSYPSLSCLHSCGKQAIIYHTLQQLIRSAWAYAECVGSFFFIETYAGEGIE